MGFDGQILRVSFTICCGLSYLLYGYDQGIFHYIEEHNSKLIALGFMSGVLLSSDWLSTVGNPSTFMQGVITSVYELGCFLGCVSSFVGSERYGRKKPIILGTVLVIAGAVIQAAAYGRVQFMVGRVLAGVRTGLNTSIIPIWQAEILPARTREMFGSFQYMLVPTGAAISYVSDRDF
jgi:MFS family permease